jgi:hypothetical protein
MIALYVAFAFALAVVAYVRGRNPIAWFAIGLAISPLFGLIVLLILPDPRTRPSPATHVKCPDCRELVLAEARACKHCGCRLIPQAIGPSEFKS